MLDGKFSLDRKIGDGGMASVWAATTSASRGPWRSS
jgi:hypothetical protein